MIILEFKQFVDVFRFKKIGKSTKYNFLQQGN